MSAMAGSVLAVGWSALIVCIGWRFRPAPSRVADLVAAGAEPGIRRTGPIERLGSAARRAVSPVVTVPTGQTEAGRSDRSIGLAVVATALAVVVSPWLAVVVAAGSVLAARLAARARRGRASHEVAASLPEVVDLFVLVAGAGRPVSAALAAVAPRASGAVGHGLRRAVRRVELAEPVVDALAGLMADVGEPIRPLVAALTASERDGTPLVSSLEQLAVETRLDRRRRGEEAARRVPVKLLFPLVLCTFPAFALLTVVPLLAGSLASLRL